MSDSSGVARARLEIRQTQIRRLTKFVGVTLVFALVAISCSDDGGEPATTGSATTGSAPIDAATAGSAPAGSAPIDAGETNVSLTVDASITPRWDSLPGLDGGPDRPVAVVTGEDNSQAMFVENEFWLSTDDRAALDDILKRYDGTIIAEIDSAEVDLPGLSSQFLIRVNSVDVGDADQFNADLTSLGVTGTGDYLVSSATGLSLLTAATHESAEGGLIGLNWIGEPADFRNRTTVEAPTGETLDGEPYNPDAFTWPALSSGDDSRLDIGVAEAWRALEAAGKLNSIPLAILDMGFQPDEDWSTDRTMTSVAGLPFEGRENLLDCGTPCPWHGTNVVSAAMAIPDNGYGTAGPAGPVAHPIAIFTTYDFFHSTNALVMARAFGARIANMSYGAKIPWYASPTVLPFDLMTNLLDAEGMLIFAAAGNSGKNVDHAGCTLGVCFERSWYTPCENTGVICVGGTRGVNADRANNSNYGSEHVDIFAPFTLWLGPDPAAPDNAARALSGTSFSSPFAAGVAALIWSADPNMKNWEVREIMMETAHLSADPDVERYVNAFDAVKQVLGNLRPELTLISPTNRREIELNDVVQLRVNVFDFEDGFACCDVVWTDRDGTVIGTGTDVQRLFDETGFYEMTATATDRNDATASVTTTVQVINSPPVMTIANPRPATEVFAGVPFNVQGTSLDLSDGGPLPCDSLTWSTDIGAELSFVGCDGTVTLDTLGPRELILTGLDSLNNRGTSSVQITVVEAPENLPPVVQIIEPGILENLANQPTTLKGSAIDPEGATNLTYEWVLTWPYDRNSRTGDNVQVVGIGAEFIWEPRDTIPDIGGSDDLTLLLLLELKVTDPAGNTAIAAVELRVLQIN